MTLTEAAEHIGSRVVYRAPHVRQSEPGEEGVITSVNSAYVFVRFANQVNSKTTFAHHLQLVTR